MAARTTLELTLNTGYIPTWGVWEAVRELIQNQQDAADVYGCPVSVDYNPNRKRPTLVLKTEGTTIDRDTLLLGATSKHGDPNSRGQYGEGYKLAFLTLSRAGYDVWMRTGDERWIPRIGYSERFKSDLLLIDTAPVDWRNEIKIEIRGVSEADWEAIKDRFLFAPGKVPSKGETVEASSHGRILLSEAYRGMLFSKGIYVGKLPDKHFWGYDLDRVELDRDRRLADPWSLRRSIVGCIESAAQSGKLSGKDATDLLSGDWAEAEIVAQRSEWETPKALTDAVAEAFVAEHGEETIAVETTAESVEAKHHGLKSVVVPKAIRRLVEKRQGRLADKLSTRGTDASKVYGADDLTEDGMATLFWAVDLIAKVEPWVSLDNVQIVDFYGPKIQGTYHAKDGAETIRLAHRLLSDPAKLIGVFIHEVAHRYGGDGSTEHHHAVMRISGEIILRTNPIG